MIGPRNVPLGDVRVRIKAGARRKYAVDDVSVPSEIRFGPKDKPVVAHLPKVVFTGLWSSRLVHFLDVDARIDKLAHQR